MSDDRVIPPVTGAPKPSGSTIVAAKSGASDPAEPEKEPTAPARKTPKNFDDAHPKCGMTGRTRRRWIAFLVWFTLWGLMTLIGALA